MCVCVCVCVLSFMKTYARNLESPNATDYINFILRNMCSFTDVDHSLSTNIVDNIISKHTHTHINAHTHTHIYIYIYIYIKVAEKPNPKR